MTLKIQAPMACFFLTLIVGLTSPAGDVQAARLVLLEGGSLTMQDGRIIENPERHFSRATPDEIFSAMSFSCSTEVQEGEEPSAFDCQGIQIGQFLIEPEAGEAIGDPVCYSYEIILDVETAASESGSASVGAGGADDIVVTFDVGPAETSVDMTEGLLEVSDLGTVASYGPIYSSNGGIQDLNLNGYFLTAIGQEINFGAGIAGAVASDAPGQAMIQAGHSLQILEQELRACSPPPALAVPANHAGWLVTLILMLALAGSLPLRRSY